VNSYNIVAVIVGIALGWLLRHHINNAFWQGVAWVVTRERVRDWLICRSFRTPYTNIMSPDGRRTYMYRWWLFNPYPVGSEGKERHFNWLPSIRIHHIVRPDADRHHHSHPWDARTIILDGYYAEERDIHTFLRTAGNTVALKHTDYHRIAEVSPGGVFTLFITWKYRGTWHFDVDGKKVPWREYIAQREGATQ
jgi:hypothetical protein